MAEKIKAHYLGHRKRLKQKLIENPLSLNDYEVLELLTGYALPRRDTKPIAKNLLQQFGNFKNILLASKQEIVSIPSVGEGFYTFLLALREFLFRAEKQKFSQKGTIIQQPKQVFDLLKNKLMSLEKEEFWIILLNNKHNLIGVEKLSQGTVDSAPVYVREILTKILFKKAKAFILAHNHPSGDPNPSWEDKNFTQKIKAVCSNLELNFLDHIIIGKDTFYSFKEHGF